MANTSIDVGNDLIASGLAGAGGDVRHQFFTLSATDATATWSVTGVKLTYILGVSFGIASGTNDPTLDDGENYYIDQDKVSGKGYWLVASNALAIARVKQVTAGTLAATQISMVLHGY